MIKIYACTWTGSSVLCICKKWSKNQDKPRNYIQELWYTHIMYCTCGRNVNKPSAPTEVEGKGLQLWSGQYGNTIAIYSFSTPWFFSLKKWCVAHEFFVLISSHCSTQIWRMKYDGSWSIYLFACKGSYVFKDDVSGYVWTLSLGADPSQVSGSA